MNTPSSAGTPNTPVRPAATPVAGVSARPAVAAPRPLPTPKPPQPRVAAAVTAARPAAPAAPKPPQPRVAAPAPGSVKPVQRVAKASDITAQDFFARLNWFENVYKSHRAYIKDLQARLTRTGTAVPNMAHVDPLKSAAGDIDPNVG